MADNGPTVVMLVGPTGGGKTSAAARMAFKYSLDQDIPVYLISTDSFRADSCAQLTSLANVIGCPFKLVSSAEELAAAIRDIEAGLAIVDTSGISGPQDLDELASLVSAANPHEVHLVVPADISAADLGRMLQVFPEIGIDKLLVTKLDQTNYRGGIIGIAAKHDIKFSYESSSRELPGKFNLFNPERFAECTAAIKEEIY